MPGKFFDPRALTMVAGDVVAFRNSDLVVHDVRIAGGAFDSGPIGRFSSWSQQIDQPGGYPFVCTLHPFMSGNLDVLAATLAAAPDGVLAGEPLTLSGRAPAGTAQLGVEQSVSGGEWTAAGGATPAPDGAFTTTVPAVEGASYRVTTPAGASPAVTPRVTARIDVHLAVERTRRHIDRAGAHDARDDGLHRHARAVLALALPLARHSPRAARRGWRTPRSGCRPRAARSRVSR